MRRLMIAAAGVVMIAVAMQRPGETSTPDAAAAQAAPYPPSARISAIAWAPSDTIRRAAPGSDNWPLAWADDDALYGAYGDGQGFEPFVERKLSLGLVRIVGGPQDFQGINLRAPTAERLGDGRSGPKASGMLAHAGVLYMWVRNTGNSQLAWSADRGRTWRWADWRFTESFGAPTFLQFGRDYAGARDAYVYVYSADANTAYDPADGMVLARVPVTRIRDRAAYEFFAGLDAARQPAWTAEIGERRPVFVHEGRSYRSGISYSPALKRYLWCQVLPESTDSRGPRYQGGFGIYDAAEPWGPWSTAFFTNTWDVGPGETCSLPPKWMSEDGRTVHMVFSGDDAFSVRRGRILLRQ
jgi:hypothetical protein